MSESFRARLRRGELLLGTMVTLTSSAVSEILADAGFDWLFIDGEHGPFDTSDIAQIIQTVSGKAACLVRIPALHETPIKKALDLGADGIIAPQVNTVEQARTVVSHCKYPPTGTRGVGCGRAHGYGLKFQSYMEQANELTTVVVQAEHVEAVANIEQIVAVEGIDCVLIGPYDLSASLGKMGQLDDPSVLAAIDRVVEVCNQAEMPLGMFGVSAAAVAPFIERGFRLITAGVDCQMIADAAVAMMSDLRGSTTSKH